MGMRVVEAIEVLETTGGSKTWVQAVWHSKGRAMAQSSLPLFGPSPFRMAYDQFSGVEATASR